jgi:hypothetical protein
MHGPMRITLLGLMMGLAACATPAGPPPGGQDQAAPRSPGYAVTQIIPRPQRSIDVLNRYLPAVENTLFQFINHVLLTTGSFPRPLRELVREDVADRMARRMCRIMAARRQTVIWDNEKAVVAWHLSRRFVMKDWTFVLRRVPLTVSENQLKDWILFYGEPRSVVWGNRLAEFRHMGVIGLSVYKADDAYYAAAIGVQEAGSP